MKIEKYYDTTLTLENLPKGGITLVTGPVGSGKSLVLHTLAKLTNGHFIPGRYFYPRHFEEADNGAVVVIDDWTMALPRIDELFGSHEKLMESLKVIQAKNLAVLIEIPTKNGGTQLCCPEILLAAASKVEYLTSPSTKKLNAFAKE